MLGCPEVVGVDVDSQAVAMARENVEANGVAHRVQLSEGGADVIDARFSLVVANILGHILLGIAQDLVDRVDEDGTLVLCGLSLQQEESIVARFGAFGCERSGRESMGDWVLLEMKKRALHE